jgi:hypothetical protein
LVQSKNRGDTDFSILFMGVDQVMEERKRFLVFCWACFLLWVSKLREKEGEERAKEESCDAGFEKK